MKTNFTYEAETSETVAMCNVVNNIVNKIAPEPATTAEVQPQPEANNFDKFLAMIPVLIEGAKTLLPMIFGKNKKGNGLIKLPDNIVRSIAFEVMKDNLTQEQYQTLISWFQDDDKDGNKDGNDESKADGNDIEPAPETEK